MMDSLSLETMRNAVRAGGLRWRIHALERMSERTISTEQVRQALLSGEVIEEYPGTQPYPSGLIHANVDGRPLHVVAAWGDGSVHVITAYEPDEARFHRDWKTRRRESDD